MKNVYLMLTRSSTLISVYINLTTTAQYTHSSISLNSALDPICSVGRHFTFLNWPAHIKREPLDREFYWWHRWARVGIYRLQVSEEGWQKIREFIDEQFERNLQFAFLGIACCKFGILREYENKMFCSQFVANALAASGEIDIQKSAALYHPDDFLKLKDISEVYRGRIGDLAETLRKQGTVE
ncbi:MAG: hypothetical protein IJM79_00510 [Erysipelotrichaceae bacterium]|nr:hypothetical protein [Erysipelotrichaceae bacterium]